MMGREHDDDAGGLPFPNLTRDWGGAHVGGGGESTTAQVLAVTGANAIVDWWWWNCVMPTPRRTLATRSGLLQRDGDVVGMDGSSPLTFEWPWKLPRGAEAPEPPGLHVRQRVRIDASPTVVDFRLVATATFGTDARKPVGSTRVLFPGRGNVVFDAQPGTRAA